MHLIKCAIIPALILQLLCSGCQYGPKRDQGSFKSTALMQKSAIVAFTYHDLIYRPAQGMSAFPDGGIPKYLNDGSVLCIYDRKQGKLQTLMDEENTLWSHGSGALYIVTARGNAMVVSQSGQLRKDLATIYTRHHILNIATKAHDTFDLSDDLLMHGRKPGPLYLADDNGTLVIITKAQDAESGNKAIPQIWVRHMGGEYLHAGTSAHYQKTLGRDVIYWNPSDRQYYAFHMDDKTTRRLEGYRPPTMTQVTEGARVGSLGTTVDVGIRTQGTWHYQPLPITPDDVRKSD